MTRSLTEGIDFRGQIQASRLPVRLENIDGTALKTVDRILRDRIKDRQLRVPGQPGRIDDFRREFEFFERGIA